MEEPSIWDEPGKAQKKMKELAALKEDVSGYKQLTTDRDDIREMIEMTDEEPDPAMVPEIQAMFESFKERFESIRMKDRKSVV